MTEDEDLAIRLHALARHLRQLERPITAEERLALRRLYAELVYLLTMTWES